jgi:hypothetical protein
MLTISIGQHHSALRELERYKLFVGDAILNVNQGVADTGKVDVLHGDCKTISAVANVPI